MIYVDHIPIDKYLKMYANKYSLIPVDKFIKIVHVSTIILINLRNYAIF